MTQAWVVARLAVRELWISFRLLAILLAFVAPGALVALVPAVLAETMLRLAIGLGIAAAIASAVAAWSIAEERQTGRAGWLLNRAVARGTYLAGWFVAIALVAVIGLVGGAVLGWLAASAVTVRLAPDGYVALLAAVGASTAAAAALGLLGGVLTPPRIAASLAAAGCLALGALAWLAPLDASLAPGGAYASLAGLSEPGRSIAPGLRAAGIGLVATAALLMLARLALERAEL